MNRLIFESVRFLVPSCVFIVVYGVVVVVDIVVVVFKSAIVVVVFKSAIVAVVCVCVFFF